MFKKFKPILLFLALLAFKSAQFMKEFDWWNLG
ncbi:TPA: quorum-sensing system DWW-type pheromone [Streptococcus equi subsp. zooepidemicus]|nr:quorum-sensing system DWW-type pheromone [Streptococcus equi]HEL0614528.1 quorum-sensing system DWW-type pheromone [Streptococcus equi subsp. zooepidemicus]HEL1087574.1 quorum-sensing system DWW-type pheromone [Streptococcus equi subsp. zooepidemicus]HEL1230409.1 quorum-sensing system DWW-type pheromone [Streptococcus equi subsp. zooepidemicus]